MKHFHANETLNLAELLDQRLVVTEVGLAIYRVTKHEMSGYAIANPIYKTAVDTCDAMGLSPTRDRVTRFDRCRSV